MSVLLSLLLLLLLCQCKIYCVRAFVFLSHDIYPHKPHTIHTHTITRFKLLRVCMRVCTYIWIDIIFTLSAIFNALSIVLRTNIENKFGSSFQLHTTLKCFLFLTLPYTRILYFTQKLNIKFLLVFQLKYFQLCVCFQNINKNRIFYQLKRPKQNKKLSTI